jgi:uncharacterized membrane protein YdjX (TVP38/TMEM64 family)
MTKSVETERVQSPEAKSVAVGTFAPPSSASSWVAEHWQKLVALALWVTLIGIYIAYTRANDLGPLDSVQAIIGIMAASVWGPLIYIAIYAVRPLLFFSATLLTLAGGYIFGPVWGIIYTIIASNLSTMVAYGMGRYFGDGFLDVDQMGSWVTRYTTRMRRNSFTTVLIMRFIFLPYDLVSYLAGLLRIEWKGFLLATALGSLPGTVAFVLAGASLEGGFDGGLPTLNPWVLAASVTIFVVSLVLSRVIKQREAAAPVE